VNAAKVDGAKVTVTLGAKPAEAVFAGAAAPFVPATACPGGVCPPAAVPVRMPLSPPPSPRHEWGEIPGYGVGWRLK
jgi:hypothetical protein